MQLYKPNSSNKGTALSINYSARTDKENQKGDKSFYIQIIAQNGWNTETKTGAFRDGKKIITKFAPHEIAGMLAAIKRNISLAEAMNTKYVFHDGEKNSSNITFEPHFKSEKRGDKWEKTNIQQGYIYRVTKTDKQDANNKESLAIGFTWAELELLRVVLEDGLAHIANAWYAENISRATEKKTVKTAKKEPEPTNEESVEEQAGDPGDVAF